MEFILIQLLGLIAWIFLLLSYWQKNINKILLFQIISGIFYIIHYYLLKADMGFIIILLDLIRDIIYYKIDWDRKLYIFMLPIYILIGIFNFRGIIGLFPIFASINDGYNLAYKDKTPIIGGIITMILWLFYDAVSKSYISVITDIIMILSNIIALTSQKIKYKKVLTK